MICKKNFFLLLLLVFAVNIYDIKMYLKQRKATDWLHVKATMTYNFFNVKSTCVLFVQVLRVVPVFMKIAT
jgi:hypothetical protein